MLFTLLGLGLFLIGAMAFAVDLSNIWFNRQAAQTAADAACTAGIMDVLVYDTNGTLPSGAGFTPGTAFDCNAHSGYSPCAYASLNGFGSSVAQGSASLGDNVYVDFPGTVTGITAPPAGLAPTAFMRVVITDNIPTFFAGMLKGMTKQSVGATAICGVIQATSPIPILVLNPTVQDALSLGGGGGQKQTGNIQILGGPSKSVQVNSSNTTAVNFKGGPTINLCQASGTYCGSAMGVWGGPTATPSNFVTSCGTNALCKSPNTQQTPQWNAPSAPIADPYASTAPPVQPTNQPDAGNWSGVGHPPIVAQNTNGCPDPSGCYVYSPGYYPNGICVGNGNCTYKAESTAIFDPGIYYLASRTCNNGNGSFCVESGSCVRPSSAVGDGSGGTIFYFSDTNSVFVGANAGGQGCTVLANFDPTVQTGTGQLQYGAACDSTSYTTLQGLITSGAMVIPFSGSVLLAPCRKPPSANTLCAPNCSLNFGDPLAANDPIGEQRGLLFFQNRTVDASTHPSWGGGGSMLLAGSMYFHQCNSVPPDAANLQCDNTTFDDTYNLGGSSGSSTYVLGDIITDQLFLQGNTAITMNLNPTAAFTVLKAALVQ